LCVILFGHIRIKSIQIVDKYHRLEPGIAFIFYCKYLFRDWSYPQKIWGDCWEEKGRKNGISLTQVIAIFVACDTIWSYLNQIDTNSWWIPKVRTWKNIHFLLYIFIYRLVLPAECRGKYQWELFWRIGPFGLDPSCWWHRETAKLGRLDRWKDSTTVNYWQIDRQTDGRWTVTCADNQLNGLTYDGMRHDIQHYDTQHNDTHHNINQHNDTQHKWHLVLRSLSITLSSAIMLNVYMLSVALFILMLSVVMLKVFRLSVGVLNGHMRKEYNKNK